MKILVVGAVAAGPKAACRARRLLPDADITLIDQDDLISYGGCGIPYYVSGDVQDEKELRSTSFHMVRDEHFFEAAKGVRVRTSTRALAIDRKEKKVLVEDVRSGDKSEIPYDKLVLATGSRPNVLPIPGVDLNGVFTISSLHKAIALKEMISTGKVESAVVIGGGAIGIEMAEALADLWGIDTTIIEFMPQLLPNLVPPYMAEMLKRHLEENGVKVFTGEGAQEIAGDGSGTVTKVVTPKRELLCQLVIMAAGVRPRGELAEEAGLQVSPFGAICVNQRMQTSDPDIYAAGDCVETLNLITGKRVFAPLGSLANRQGRVVADNLAGIPTRFDGVVGSFIMKAFDVAIGATGLSLEAARREGFDAVEAVAAQADRAHFIPTQAMMFMNLVVERSGGRVLGLQGYGQMGDGVMARINAVAGLLGRGTVVGDISRLELAYAPPFSNAVDILNTAGNIADNLLAHRLRTVTIQEFSRWMEGDVDRPQWVALDLRHTKEAAPWVDRHGEKWLSIPYDEIRTRIEEVPRDKTLILICNAGTRSYEVQRVLESHGFDNLMVLPGGLNVIRRIRPTWWVE